MILKLKQSKDEKGLSLIELSIILTVIGLLVSGFLQLYNIQAQKKLNSLQNYKILTIRDGLAKFLEENKRLPCPAPRNVALTDENAGGETDCSIESIDPDNCDDGNAHAYCIVENIVPPRTVPLRVRIGSIPFKALNLGREDVIDVYGNQFTYAVAEFQTRVDPDPTDPDTDGYVFYDRELDSESDPLKDNRAIDLRNISPRQTLLTEPTCNVTFPPSNNCDPITKICQVYCEEVGKTVDMLFYSHGKDGMGSYTASGALNGNECTDNDDAASENCDNDATFISDVYAVRSDNITGEYDDRLRYSLADWTYIWTDSSTDSSNIFNNTAGNMGVGTKEPEEKLHVQGGNVRIEQANVGGVDVGGKAQASQLCDNEKVEIYEDGILKVYDGCFEPEMIGGDEDSEKRLVCGEGEVMKKIIGGEEKCVTVLDEEANDDCAGTFDFVTGFTLNVATGSLSAECDTLN